MPTPVVTQAAVNGGLFNTIRIGSNNTLDLRGTGLLVKPGGAGLQLTMAGLSFSGINLLSNPFPDRASLIFQASSSGVFGLGFLRIVVINTDGSASAPRELQVTYFDDTLLRAIAPTVRLANVHEPFTNRAAIPADIKVRVNAGGPIVVGPGQINHLAITGTDFSGPSIGLALQPPDLDFLNIQVQQWTSSSIDATFEARYPTRSVDGCGERAVGMLTVTVVNLGGGTADRTIEVLYPEQPIEDLD